jgi:glycosyltransferase involved in cell wall biosynthesis
MFLADFKLDPFRFLHSIEITIQQQDSNLLGIQTSNQVRPKQYEAAKYYTDIKAASKTVIFDRPSQAGHLRTIFDRRTNFANVVAKYLEPKDILATQEFISKKKILFAGCARNCATSVAASLSTLSKLGKYFYNHEVIIFENDSTDETRETLENARDTQQLPLTIVTQSGLDKILPQRTQRLAHARNTVLETTREKYSEFDYLCWADMDGIVNENFSTNGFLSNFSLDQVWDGVFPVTNTFYYDIWALRHSVLCPEDYHSQMERSDAALGNDFIVGYHAHMRQSRLQNLPTWLSVDSAFGGMGIYKISSIANARYQGMIDDTPICEHVPFNTKIVQNGGRLYINPAFTVNYPENINRNGTLQRILFKNSLQQ